MLRFKLMIERYFSPRLKIEKRLKNKNKNKASKSEYFGFR